MRCPTCSSEMESVEIDELVIDECNACKSIWFDSDELRIVKDKKDPDLNWMDFEFWKHPESFKVNANPRKCPRCNVNLVAITYGHTDVEVDCCPTCKGTLLEKGELAAIISSLENELLTKSPTSYLRDTLVEAKEILTGKEGLVSEWKDFATALRFLKCRFLAAHPLLGERIIKFYNINPFK